MEERNAALRAELHAAREAGDISLGEYLSELRKLRECGAPASGADEASSATAHSKAARAFAPAEAGDGASSSDDDDLVDEDGCQWKRARTTATPERGNINAETDAPDSAPRSVQPQSSDHDRSFPDDDGAKAEIQFVIARAGMRVLGDFITELEQRDYGDATRQKLRYIYDNQIDSLQLQLAAMLDMQILVKTTYELEGDRLEIMLTYDRIEGLRNPCAQRWCPAECGCDSSKPDASQKGC